jgi:hypothetical protein
MSAVAQILSAVIQIAANYGGTLTQPTNFFNNPVTTGNAIVVFVSWRTPSGYLVSVTDPPSGFVCGNVLQYERTYPAVDGDGCNQNVF